MSAVRHFGLPFQRREAKLAAQDVRGTDLTPSSYQCNRGDYWLNWDWWESRGVFGRGGTTTHSMLTIKDATSNTMMISELKNGVRGSRQITETVARDVGAFNGAPPSLCLARVGPLRTFTESIDAGDPTRTGQDMPQFGGGNPQDYPGPSSYGLWGALATANGARSSICPNDPSRSLIRRATFIC